MLYGILIFLTYNFFQTAAVSLKDCIQALGNVTTFHDELEEAKKTGSMDEVFGKYCAKTPQVKTCIKDFRVHLEACLDSTEKTALNTTLDIVRRLGEFLCYKDGDRLASKDLRLIITWRLIFYMLLFFSVYR